MDGNKLVKLKLGLFEGLPNLKRLTMNSNTLVALENENQLTKMTTGVSLAQLQYFGLNNNMLQSLPDELFQNMINLKIMDLGTNHIMQLDEGLFFSLSLLVELNLSHNFFRSLPDELFKNLIDLEILV